jgi:hypothetical protein
MWWIQLPIRCWLECSVRAWHREMFWCFGTSSTFNLHTRQIAHLALGKMNAGRIAASACKAARVFGHISRSPLPGLSHCVRHVDTKQLSRCFSSKIPSRRPGNNSEASSGQSSASEASTGALHGQSPPYRNKEGFDTLNIGPDARRSLTITKFPTLVIDDDIRELFEESGFYPYDHSSNSGFTFHTDHQQGSDSYDVRPSRLVNGVHSCRHVLASRS